MTRVVDTDTIEYQLTSDPGAVTLSSATLRPVWRFTATASPGSKFWNDLGWANEDLKVRSATVLKLRVMQDGSTAATFYVDRAQATQGTGAGQRAFIEGSGPTQLWQAMNRLLAEAALPATSYEGGLLDQARLGLTLPVADVTMGGPVDLYVPSWGLTVSTRVVSRRRDLLLEGETEVGLSSRPADVIDEQVRPPRGNRLVVLPPSARRRRYTIPISGTAFKPLTSTDASRLVVNFSGGIQAIVNQTFSTTGVCSAPLAGDLLTLGARIVGLKTFSDQSNPAAPGSAIFRLYRGDTILLEGTTIGQGYGLTTSSEVLSASGYSLYASLTNSGSSQVWLERMEITLEVDEPA